MVPHLQLLPAFFSLLILSSHAQSFRPKALIIPVTKDVNTRQYVTTITQRTPPVPVELVVDLGGQFVWIDCQSGYTSSSYRPARCRSAQCSRANANPGCSDCTNPPSPGCNNDTCELSPQNDITEIITNGYVSMDVLSLRSTNGYTPGRVVTVPQFIFACTRSFLLEGLASGARGVAGFGQTRIALPSQLAAAFSFDRKFAICLSPSGSGPPGVIFFGDGPYLLTPETDVSRFFIYTKLLRNPVSTNGVALRGEGSFEYYIGVRNITVNGRFLPLNASLLTIARDGSGGTKFSTVFPYTILESSIYRILTESFIRDALDMNIVRVPAVAPFTACFDSNTIGTIRGRMAVPGILLFLQNINVAWTIYGTSAMVQVGNGVSCLGFVDASTVPNFGGRPRAAITLGGYQLENYLIQFDLATSRVGFSSMLYDYSATCSAFQSTI